MSWFEELTIEEIQGLINKTEDFLINSELDYQNVAVEELVEYFNGPAPSGDLTTLSDVIRNRWLLIHELVEISELKRMNLSVSAKLLITHPTEVDYAHITALEYELKYAKLGGDHDWITKRISGINSWLDDDKMMPADLKSLCHRVVEKYSK